MKLLLGWSQEVEVNHWERADVELDESDLRAVLAENVPELPIETDIAPGIKFMLLKVEIERLITVHQYEKGIMTKVDATVLLDDNRTKRAAIFKKIRDEYIAE